MRCGPIFVPNTLRIGRRRSPDSQAGIAAWEPGPGTGNGAAAEGHYLNALVAFRSTGQRSDAAAVLSNLGNLAHELRDLRRATGES